MSERYTVEVKITKTVVTPAVTDRYGNETSGSREVSEVAHLVVTAEDLDEAVTRTGLTVSAATGVPA